MITIKINPKSPAGRRIIKEVSSNPTIGTVDHPLIPRDEQGNVIGYTVDYFCDELRKRVKAKFDAENEKK